MLQVQMFLFIKKQRNTAGTTECGRCNDGNPVETNRFPTDWANFRLNPLGWKNCSLIAKPSTRSDPSLSSLGDAYRSTEYGGRDREELKLRKSLSASEQERACGTTWNDNARSPASRNIDRAERYPGFLSRLLRDKSTPQEKSTAR